MIPRYLLTLSAGYSGTHPRLHLAIVMVKELRMGVQGAVVGTAMLLMAMKLNAVARDKCNYIFRFCKVPRLINYQP